MEARLLGSAGWFAARGRETTCVLVRDDEAALLLDAGTGLQRLVGSDLLDGVASLDIVLTHFHLDRVAGLNAVPALARPRRRPASSG